MDLLEQASIVEDLEVATDGHVGDAELAHEVGDPDRAVLADAIEDEGLALSGEHQRTARRSAGAVRRCSPASPSCRTKIAAPSDRKSTDSDIDVDKSCVQVLDIAAVVRTIRVILSDFVGQVIEEESAMAEPTRVDAVSRRTVLKGIAGAAGLVSVPAIIAACSSPAASSAPSAAATPRPRAAASAASAAAAAERCRPAR